MISKKIIYYGQLDTEKLGTIFEIVRKIEITGTVAQPVLGQVELNLEGDLSMIKLIEHQIERRIKQFIERKEVQPLPFQNFNGITLLPTSSGRS